LAIRDDVGAWRKTFGRRSSGPVRPRPPGFRRLMKEATRKGGERRARLPKGFADGSTPLRTWLVSKMPGEYVL